MPGVDLDALRQLEPESQEPFTYRLGGRDFTAVRAAPAQPLAAAAAKLRGADGVESFVQMVGVIFDLTEPHQHRQLRKVLLSKRDPIDPATVVTLFWALCEHFTPDMPTAPAAPLAEEKPMETWERLRREGAYQKTDGEWADVIDFATRTGGEVITDG